MLLVTVRKGYCECIPTARKQLVSTGNCGIHPNARVIRLEKHVVIKIQDTMDINFLSTFSDVLLAWIEVKYSHKFMFSGQGYVRRTATVKFSPTHTQKKRQTADPWDHRTEATSGSRSAGNELGYSRLPLRQPCTPYGPRQTCGPRLHEIF